jgi:hypothetical protein
MSIVWKPPSILGASWFAEWNGRTFAFVRKMPDGLWRVGVFPDGESHHSRDGMAGSLDQAKRWVERWAKHHHALIKPAPGRQIMPHEVLKPRKPKGSDERS